MAAQFAFDGRIWHGTGSNVNGMNRRHLGYNFCLPWVRQQENWGVSTLQEVLDEASPLVQERLGLLIYGTMGGATGTRHAHTLKSRAAAALRALRVSDGASSNGNLDRRWKTDC